ncbi:MAG: hypothetical protein ACQCN3_10625 [Candidatus Bathyarchaeia archaeon]
MQKTKIITATVIIAALTLAFVGLAAAQATPNQTNTTTNQPNTATNNGVWGWIGNCFGHGANQPYNNEYCPQEPYQGSYGNTYGCGYGYGPCWTR